MSLNADQMAALVEPFSTVSDRIRALDAAGIQRADIARFLGKRYQHVRNVLEGDAQSGGYTLGRADLSGVREGPAPFEQDQADDVIFVELTSAIAHPPLQVVFAVIRWFTPC